MGQGVVQASFTAGELSPSLYGRVDFAKYYTGLKVCKNFFVRQYGGVSNRPGTHLAAETKFSGSKVVRQIPFQFSTLQAYVLEFGDYYFRVIMNGGYVLSGGVPVEFATIYPAADLALIKYTQSYDVMTLTHPSYPAQQLSRHSHTSWTFAAFLNVNGPFKDINIDQSKTVSASSQTGPVTLTSNADVFTADMVGLLFYLEASPNAQALGARVWEVQKSINIYDIRRGGMNFYQAQTSGVTGTVRPSTLEGVENDGDPGVTWMYRHSGFGIVQITGFTSTKVVTGTVLSLLPETLVNGVIAKNITGAIDGGSGNIIVSSVAHGFGNGDPVTIAGVVGTAELNGSWFVTGIDANTFSVPCVFVNPYVSGGTATKTLTAAASHKWALEAWGSTDQYPATVAYFQQRQLFAGSSGRPQTFWLSTSGGYTDYTRSVPTQDNDACNYTLASKDVNEIRHAVDLTKLLLFTSGGIWVVNGNADGVITPAATNVKRQVSDGANHLAPLVIGGEALFVLDKGSQVKAVGYNWQKDTFLGNDLTVMSSHLFEGHQIVSWAYQKIPFSCAWAVREDGVMLCLTYLAEQEVAGWSQHNTDGFYEDVCVITEGNVDVLYAIVRRNIGGVDRRFIERFQDRLFSDVKDAYFVDCGLSYSGAPATHFSGLDHLEGKTVSILADGCVRPQQVVVGGAVTLTDPASTVHVGLPYVATIETLDLSIAQTEFIAKQKLVNMVTALVQETAGLMAGADVDHLIPFRTPHPTNYGQSVVLLTDQAQIRIQSSWSKGGNVVIQQQNPLPVTILALIPNCTAGGT